MTFGVREMTQADLAAAFELSQQVRWPHRLEDWRQAWALGGGVVAVGHGRTIGCALHWRWGPRATLGLVIVAASWRGQGIAKAMMSRLMASVPACHLHLAASEQGRPLYQKLGFAALGPLAQHQCAELPQRAPRPLAAGQSLRPALPRDLAALAALDAAASGMQRRPLFEALLSGNEQALVLERQGEMLGFAIRRRFGYGQLIGPVIAPRLQAAVVLTDALLQACAGQFVRVDTPNGGLSDWLTQRGLPCIDTPTLMVRGTPHSPDADGVQTFALVSQALS
ncbi:Predicted acetyltransferase [Serratia ficaria]|uniref:GNAT family N-acetyltransferase n=1 Tax=Serratia TaxID=613 RepID=UPI001F5CB225|nr:MULTISPECIES: GNAT family N-acetyltransferase [Serratia]CAI1682371.1 Predicted acetyltransferase [Serratia ficaria]CAI2511580.1 Predicted acetyltransferase [Serratia ficaria]CAI2531958.1 Predicted acetyltransferase [Serratia ficaria]